MFIAFAFLTLALALSLTGGDSEPSETDEDITGTEGDDTIQTGGGNDLVQGLGGNDTIDGGAGDDTLFGGDGDDWLDGGAGINEVSGDAGDDTLVLHDGFDYRSGIDENGQFFSDNSSFSGGAGSDLLDASGMTEDLHIEVEGSTSGVVEHIAQDDYRAVRIEGFERYATGSGRDFLALIETGVAELDVNTGAGNDTILVYGPGQHRIDAGTGDDTVSVDYNAGTAVDGGSGDDALTVTLSRDAAITLDATGSGSVDQGDGPLLFTNFEHFHFDGSGSSLIDASAIDQGSDIFGDSVIGGLGDDTLAGNDLTGGAGDDLLSATLYADGGDGNDQVDAETALGGAGDDTVSGDYADGGTGNDIVDGYYSAQGGDGDDVVHSEGLAEGGAGNDTVSGNEMTGGEGLEHFAADARVYNNVFIRTPDVITDYEPGESVALLITYNNTDSLDPTLPIPAPVVTIEQDSLANEVRVLVNGEAALIVQGTDSIPDSLLQITTEGYNPWDDPNYTP